MPGEGDAFYHDSKLYNFPATGLPALGLQQSQDPTRNGGPSSGADCHAARFRQFCVKNDVDVAPVDLGLGDMCFSKTDNVHEAPGFGGAKARSVFCTFIGYGPDDPEIFVWS